MVGGSYLKNDIKKEMTDTERERLLENARRLGVDASAPLSGWRGYRPARSTIRCDEGERVSGVMLIHSYGHGGWGWTVNVGVAEETAQLLGLE